MSRILSLCILLAITSTVLCGGFGGGWGMMGLGKEANAVMCKAENLNDDKFDQFRAGMEACNLDECVAQTDDISAITKPENKRIAKNCSQKYMTCVKSKSQKGEDTQEPDEATKKMWEEKKACIKAAFEKAFGAIGA